VLSLRYHLERRTAAGRNTQQFPVALPAVTESLITNH
jgi:hypothetical protein